LHAAELRLHDPKTGRERRFEAPPFDPDTEPWLELRAAIVTPDLTDGYRLIHAAADGWPGWYVDRHGQYVLSQSEQPLSPVQRDKLQRIADTFSLEGAYHKALVREVQDRERRQISPQLVFGRRAPADLVIRENGLQFALSYSEGYSVGLFLDQRDNRRRLLTNYVAAGFPLFESGAPSPRTALNTFAYTCGFSMCAARSGMHVTSLDLSKKYLSWGKRNFQLNQLDSAAHDFVYGDVFDWLRRFGKMGRKFDIVILDPPTFSQSKEHGRFQVERDYEPLTKAALSVLKTNGVLLACTNAASIKPESFLEKLRHAIHSVRRRIGQIHYAPQPPDFPITRDEPSYLKSVWLRIL
jgi:23S rRNA (cytosine1962-C5)-methyltransferase